MKLLDLKGAIERGVTYTYMRYGTEAGFMRFCVRFRYFALFSHQF